MAWLRIDDGFYSHPKVLKLTRPERWTWMEVLCFCARYETGGEIPIAISEALPKANPAFLAKCVDLELLDRTDEPGLVIHDWKVYNPRDPTNSTRQQRHREKTKHRDSNGEVTENVTAENVTTVTPRARAPRPVPFKEPFLPSTPTKAPKEGRTFEIADNILKEIDAA